VINDNPKQTKTKNTKTIKTKGMGKLIRKQKRALKNGPGNFNIHRKKKKEVAHI
jgi:hypothetical protein